MTNTSVSKKGKKSTKKKHKSPTNLNIGSPLKSISKNLNTSRFVIFKIAKFDYLYIVEEEKSSKNVIITIFL